MLKEIKNEKNWSRAYDWLDWTEISFIVIAELLEVYGLYFIILPLSLFIGRADLTKYKRNKQSGAYDSKSLRILDTWVLVFQIVVFVCSLMRIYEMLLVQ